MCLEKLRTLISLKAGWEIKKFTGSSFKMYNERGKKAEGDGKIRLFYPLNVLLNVRKSNDR